MKFKFCGDLDAPDWILREIALLSKITSVRMRIICAQIINDILTGNLDYDKIFKATDAHNFTTSDVKAAVAALTFIITNATKYNVDDTTLSNELQQLGLPKENCDSLAKPYQDAKQKLKDTLSGKTLKLPRMKDVEWRLDYVLSTDVAQDVNMPSVQLKIVLEKPASKVEEMCFELSTEKLRLLIAELKVAQEVMSAM